MVDKLSSGFIYPPPKPFLVCLSERPFRDKSDVLTTIHPPGRPQGDTCSMHRSTMITDWQTQAHIHTHTQLFLKMLFPFWILATIYTARFIGVTIPLSPIDGCKSEMLIWARTLLLWTGKVGVSLWVNSTQLVNSRTYWLVEFYSEGW